MKLRDIFIALIAVLVFGTSFVAVKLGVREIPPLLLASLRFFFAAVPAIFFVRRPEVPIRFVVSFGLTMGAFQFALLYSAIRLGMPAGLSSVVLQTQVCFTVLLAYICFGEKPLPLEIIGSLVALVGVVVCSRTALWNLSHLLWCRRQLLPGLGAASSRRWLARATLLPSSSGVVRFRHCRCLSFLFLLMVAHR